MKTHTYILTTILFWLMLPSSGLNGQDKTLNFERGNKLYTEGDYQAAVSAYKDVIVSGYGSAELYYNLGTAYYQLDSIGLAILNLERAQALAPSDNNIRHNLELAKSRVESEIFEIKPFILLQWMDKIARLMRPGLWMLLEILLFMVAAAALFVWQFSPDSGLRLKSLVTLALSCVLIISVFFLGRRSYDLVLKHRRAVVMEQTELMLGPDPRSGVIEELPEGMVVTVADSLDGWYKIELGNRETGWVGQEWIEPIYP